MTRQLKARSRFQLTTADFCEQKTSYCCCMPQIWQMAQINQEVLRNDSPVQLGPPYQLSIPTTTPYSYLVQQLSVEAEGVVPGQTNVQTNAHYSQCIYSKCKQPHCRRPRAFMQEKLKHAKPPFGEASIDEPMTMVWSAQLGKSLQCWYILAQVLHGSQSQYCSGTCGSLAVHYEMGDCRKHLFKEF